jgi:adenylate kinase family enzyme
MGNKPKEVYIISGPAGVGKSTTSKELVKKLSRSAYISGDYISHMHVNGRKKPWESEEETSLIWTNILSLTKNFLDFNNDVVIDYVTFPSEAKWLKENLKDTDVSLNYVVLWTDKDTLMKRDELRKPEHRMGERCLVLMDEFKASGLDDIYLLDTSERTNKDVDFIIEQILSNQNFKIT